MICLQCEKPVHGHSVVISGFDGRIVFWLHPSCAADYASQMLEMAEYLVEQERERQQRVRLAAATKEVARELR